MCCHKKLGIWFSSWSRHTTPKWVWVGYIVGIPRNLVSSTQTQSSIPTCHVMLSRLSRFKKILPNFKSLCSWLLNLKSEITMESSQSANCHFASSFYHLNKWLFYFPFSDSKLFITTIIIIVIMLPHILCVCFCVYTSRFLNPYTLMLGHGMFYNFIQLNLHPVFLIFALLWWLKCPVENTHREKISFDL